MDRALPTTITQQRTKRRWLLIAAALLLMLGGVFAFRSALQPSIRQADLLTARVETGDVEAALTAAGTVIPGREEVIVSPIQSTIRRVAVAVGGTVQPGQTILQLDKEQASSELAKLSDEQLRNQNKNS